MKTLLFAMLLASLPNTAAANSAFLSGRHSAPVLTAEKDKDGIHKDETPPGDDAPSPGDSNE